MFSSLPRDLVHEILYYLDVDDDNLKKVESIFPFLANHQDQFYKNIYKKRFLVDIYPPYVEDYYERYYLVSGSFAQESYYDNANVFPNYPVLIDPREKAIATKLGLCCLYGLVNLFNFYSEGFPMDKYCYLMIGEAAKCPDTTLFYKFYNETNYFSSYSYRAQYNIVDSLNYSLFHLAIKDSEPKSFDRFDIDTVIKIFLNYSRSLYVKTAPDHVTKLFSYLAEHYFNDENPLSLSLYGLHSGWMASQEKEAIKILLNKPFNYVNNAAEDQEFHLSLGIKNDCDLFVESLLNKGLGLGIHLRFGSFCSVPEQHSPTKINRLMYKAIYSSAPKCFLLLYKYFLKRCYSQAIFTSLIGVLRREKKDLFLGIVIGATEDKKLINYILREKRIKGPKGGTRKGRSVKNP